MIFTDYAMMMTILWSSLLIILFYMFRKSGRMVQLCSVSGVLVLYLFCILRMLLPVEFEGWTKVVHATAILNPLSSFCRHEIFSGMKVYHVLYAVWIIGAAAFIGRYLLLYYQWMQYFMELPEPAHSTMRKVCREIFVTEMPYRIRISGAVRIPCCVGIRNKMIILPDKDYSEQQMYYILLHESAHLKNHDPFIIFLVHIFCGLFWWNPAVYLLKKDLSQSMEIRCDALVVQDMDQEKRSGYLAAILEEFKGTEGESRADSRFMMQFFEEHGKDMIERFSLVSKGNGKQGNPAVAYAAAACLLIASYSVVFQPEFSLSASEFEAEKSGNGILVPPGEFYITKHRDGTYTLRLQEKDIVVSEETANEMMYRSTNVFLIRE